MKAKRRNRARTEQSLMQAVGRFRLLGRAVSIREVALDAGFDPSLIHHSYPEVAEEIRKLGVRPSSERDRERARRLIVMLRRVRKERMELRRDVARLASIQASLQERLREIYARQALKRAPDRGGHGEESTAALPRQSRFSLRTSLQGSSSGGRGVSVPTRLPTTSNGTWMGGSGSLALLSNAG